MRKRTQFGTGSGTFTATDGYSDSQDEPTPIYDDLGQEVALFSLGYHNFVIQNPGLGFLTSVNPSACVQTSGDWFAFESIDVSVNLTASSISVAGATPNPNVVGGYMVAPDSRLRRA